MRLILDYTPAVAQRAGIGRYARELAAALMVWLPDDAVTLFTAARPDQPPALPSAWRLRVAPLGERGLTRLWHRARAPLPAEWLAGPADLWHGLDFTLPPVQRMRRVVTIHDTAFWDQPECAAPRLAAYLAQVVPRAARAADAVLCPSDHARRSLLAHLPDLAPERVAVVPLGVGQGFGAATPAAQQRIADRLALAHPFVLAAGTIEPRKNYPRLLAAFDQARRMPGGPRLLVIAGRRGWRSEAFDAALAGLRAPDAVRLAPDLDDADLAALYAQADVVAHVALSEGFGLPLLEAMRSGAPVVASAGGALPEVAGDAALLVPPTDVAAIAHALHHATIDPELRRRLIAAGHARAARYTWDAAARATLAVYRQALR